MKRIDKKGKGPKVIAITLNWNRKFDTEECVNSLLELKYPNYEIVVVDNGSTDGSVDHLRKTFGDKIYIAENEKNLGYSDGFNSGIYFANEKDFDYLLILNNDTKIGPEALTELVRTAEADERIGFVSGKVYFYDKPNLIQTAGKRTDTITLVGAHIGEYEVDIGQYDQIKDYDFIDDVFLLVRKEVIKKVGSYDSNFFLYLEETDWCVRVRKAGYRIVYTPDAKIWHKGSLSSGGGINPISTYWISRNTYLFMWRNGTPKQWRYFLLKNYFFKIPLSIIASLIKGKVSIIKARIDGNIAGIIWTLKHLDSNKEVE